MDRRYNTLREHFKTCNKNVALFENVMTFENVKISSYFYFFLVNLKLECIFN